MTMEFAKKETKASPSDDLFSPSTIGNVLHCLGLAVNLAVTAAIMLGWPTADTYDVNWKEKGQCNVDFGMSNTSVYCAASLVASGLGLLGLGLAAPGGRRSPKTMNQQLERRCQVMGRSNISHGLGHLFLHFIGNAIPPIEFVFRADAIGYLLVLCMFWPPVFMQTVSNITVGQAVAMSAVVLACQVALDVPPHLAFTYSQSVILVLQSLDQLSIPKTQKEEHGSTYVAFALYYLPLFPLMWIETTKCTSVLADYGGHFVYDLYLSVMPFLLVYLIQNHYGGGLTNQKVKSS